MVITLIGYRGSGKSTVASGLAARLGCEWIDADAVIEQAAGRSIREIFEAEGEPGFRRREREAIAGLLGRDWLVLAAGGGAILNADTRREMQAAGPVVWLQASAGVLAERIAADPATSARRPNLAGGGLDEITRLLAEREPLYRECATLSIFTDQLAVPEIVERIAVAVAARHARRGPVNVLDVEYGIVLLGLFILGTVFGSMLNVAIYRLPREERLWPSFKFMVHPPSHCPRCRVPIRFYDNIPIIGWMKLRGRCRNCRGTISIRYPLIEALTGLLFVLLYWFEVPSIWGFLAHLNSSVWHPLGPGPGPSPGLLVHCRYALHVVLLVSLIASTFIDIDLRIIPDSATLPAMAIAVLAHTIAGNLYIAPLWYQTPAMSAGAWGFFLPAQGLIPAHAMPAWLANWPAFVGVPAWITAHPHLHGFCLSVAGIIVGGGSIWAVRLAGQWALKREAMGFGDVVLMAMIGSFIGWQGTLIVFLLGMVLAVVVALPMWLIRRDRELPYGPYLAGGTLLLLLTARHTWPWFEVRFLAMGPLLVPIALVMMVSLALMLLGWRTAQRALGFAPADEWIEDPQWLPGDQLAYLANQAFDDTQGQWRRPEWPGCPAARGQIHYRAWRYGN